LQNPLTLNASTLEGLYDLLNHTDVRYIILPKKGIIVDTEKPDILSSSNFNYNGNISNVLRFVLDNFPRAYEDQNYIVLEVLPLTSPSPTSSSVALIYQRDFDELLPQVSNYGAILPVDSGSFGSQKEESSTKNNSDYDYNIDIQKVEAENKNLSTGAYSLTLGGNVTNNNSRSITLWSSPIQEIQQNNNLNGTKNNLTIINYIEGNFKIMDDLSAQNKSEKKNASKFGAGIVWEHNNKTYLASVSDVGLQLSQRPSELTLLNKRPELVNYTKNLKQAPEKLILSQNEEIKRQKDIWYNLKILFLKNNVEIYLNDILRAKIPGRDYYYVSSNEKNITEHPISRVGINTYYSKSEFQPIILGQIPTVGERSYPLHQKIYYQHYYPLNTLALSKIKYDAYIDGDLSAFSNKYVVLPFDKTPHQKNEAITYLEFVNNGGNLIVINSDNKFNGIFSKIFQIKPGNLTKFNSIETYNSGNTGEKKYSINVSGISRSIEINSYDNLAVKSYYVDKGNDNESQNVAPFVIEKKYGNGKIIFVNAMGYYEAILGKSYSSNNTLSIKTPHFVTLSKVAPMIGIPADNAYLENNSPPITIGPTSRIIGDIRISPKQTIIINSSNLLLPDNNSSSTRLASYNLSSDDVSISLGQSQQISLTNHRISNNSITSNVTNNYLNATAKNTDNGVMQNYFDFKKVLIKDLELYGGPFQIIINVTNNNRPVYLPTSLSYNDYIAMSIPKGFDMTVKFPDSISTYVQLDMIKKNEKNSFQRLKVSGFNNDSNDSSNSTGQIVFHDVSTDNKAISYMTALMKSPEIKILNEDRINDMDKETNSLKFKKNSPDSTPIEIKKASGDIKINVDHVDNYDEPYHNWIRTKFITYLKNDIQITDQNNSVISQAEDQSLFTKLMAKKPGDISDYAKEHGIEVPWRKVISSTPSIIMALILVTVIVTVIAITWSKITKINKVK
jgi:hypothetical protein